MSTYGWILLSSIAFPVLLSFDKRVAFWRRWPFVAVAAIVVALPFLFWDVLAAARGDWGFAAAHARGLSFLGLPVEEFLFFLLVPFACVFVHACVDSYIGPVYFRFRRWPLVAAAAAAAIISIALSPRFYSSTVMAFCSLFFFLAATVWSRFVHTGSFWLAQLLCLVPFLAVNGILTGIPVVTYSPRAILGLRLFSIPVEDLAYSFVLVGANICLSEVLRETWTAKRRRARPARPAGYPDDTDNAWESGGKIAVIGAGLGGLAVAARLAHAGYKVTVFESARGPGGKAGSIRTGGYRFDTGPSLVTMISVYRDLFQDCGADVRDYLRFVPLPSICSYFWADGSRFQSCSAKEMPEALAVAFGEDPSSVTAYFERVRGMWEAVAPVFLERSPAKFSTFLSRDALRGIARIGQLSPFETLHSLHLRYFRNERVIQLFDRVATYNGSDPYRCPATLAVVAHAEYGLGAYALSGGVETLPAAVEKLAKNAGVEFRYSKTVTAVATGKDGVLGLSCGHEFHPASAVVSDIDVASFYQKFGTSKRLPSPASRKVEPSSSAIVFYWGLRGNFPVMGVNSVFFSKDYRKEFNSIFLELRCPDDPTVYVNITSRIDSVDAPPACENWFVLVNAPRNAGQDWRTETDRVRAAVVAKISAALGEDISARIQTEIVRTPADIEAESGSRYGSLYGGSSNSPMAAFHRHPNEHPLIRGLYFCGGSVHPGGGMPLVTLSGKIAADIILDNDRKRSPRFAEKRDTE